MKKSINSNVQLYASIHRYQDFLRFCKNKYNSPFFLTINLIAIDFYLWLSICFLVFLIPENYEKLILP